MPGNVEIIIGEFFPQPSKGTLVFASVYATRQVKGEMSVIDMKEKTWLFTTIELEQEGDAIELNTGQLPPGNYLVTIRINAEQFERTLQVGQ